MAAAAAVVLALFVSGCAGTGPAPVAPGASDERDPSAAELLASISTNAPLASTSQLDQLRVGTRIVITVTDIPEPRQFEEVIGEDGFLTLPFDKRIMAVGKTKRQVQDEIIAQYVPDYFQRMTVNISLQEQFFSVLGEVRNPSRQLYAGQMTVLKAIAAAGGFTEFAKKSRVFVIRAGEEKPIRVDASDAQSNPKLDIQILPNDQVLVERRFF
jgi:polysaccharide biosynthesis/export protein VpsN